MLTTGAGQRHVMYGIGIMINWASTFLIEMRADLMLKFQFSMFLFFKSHYNCIGIVCS